MGRPSGKTQEILDTICDRIAGGESLRAICDSDDMPSRSAVLRWLSEDESFQRQYARAREVQADAIFDEILDIADDARNDWMRGREESAADVLNAEHIQRSRLRIDARKWMAGKLRPKVYGDKLELAGDANSPLQVVIQRHADDNPS